MNAWHWWHQGDMVTRVSAVLLLAMSVASWVVILWKAWLLRRAVAGVGRGTAAFWQSPVGVSVGGLGLHKPLLLWVNDGLMTLFFFVVGLEIKRELVDGELREPHKAALPIVAALGGMAVETPAAPRAAVPLVPAPLLAPCPPLLRGGHGRSFSKGARRGGRYVPRT